MRKLLIILFVFMFVNGMSQSWHSLTGQDSLYGIYCYYFDSTNNELYIGGHFKEFNGLQANHIVKWNGQQWQTVGDGFNRQIFSITKHKNEIVAAGAFDSSGTTPFKMPIARWNGTQWLPFDTVTTSGGSFGGPAAINDVISFNDELYALGSFGHEDLTFPPDSFFRTFAYWNDTIWQAAIRNPTPTIPWPGGIMVTYITSGVFEIFNNELYLGSTLGLDTCTATGQPSIFYLGGLVKYNLPCRSVEIVGSTTAWGSGDVKTMLSYNGSLYLGLDHYNPTYGSYITRYDGTNFYPVGTGLNYEVLSLTTYQGQMIAGGKFTANGNNTQPLSYVAAWDGINWNPLPGTCNLDGWVYNLFGHDSLLFAAGTFDSCGTTHIGYSAAVYPNSITGVNGIISPQVTFSILPNPSDGLIQILAPINGNVSMEVFDITGRIRHQSGLEFKSEKTVLNLVFLEDGIYFLRVITKENVYSAKFIIRH